MEQRETKGLSKRVDAFLLAHLDHLALVPVLLYLATPLIDLAIVVANGYVYDDEREVYRTVVDLVAHPLGTCFAIVCALAVIRLMVRGYLRTSRCRLAAMVPFAIFLVLATCSTFANPDNPYRFTGIDPSYVGIGSYFLFVIATTWSDLSSIISGSDDAGGAGSGRWGLWVITADRISDRPWLGWGAEGICDGLLEPGNTERSHCEPLMYAAYFGIPAMVCYLAGVFATFVGAWRRRRTIDPTSVACACAAFSYFVSSCFGNMYFYTTPFYFILLGMALCRLESKGDATDILIGDRT